MKSRFLWALAGVNVALAMMFVFSAVKENQAVAQRVMRPADYLLIPGEISGAAGTGVVYIIDSSNGMLGAMAYNDSKDVLDIMPTVDLARLFEGTPAGR